MEQFLNPNKLKTTMYPSFNINILILIIGSFCWSPTIQAQSKGAFKKTIKKHRKAYKEKFTSNERAPFHNNEKALKQLKFYKANLDYQVKCKFQRTADAPVFQMATYSGKTKNYKKYGTLYFEIDGHAHELSVYQSLQLLKVGPYKDYLFIPFKDLTNDVETYGGGRYMDIKISDIKDDAIVLDFNKAYNPWCAYSDGYNCPIPPKENHLNILLKAGEKSYAGEYIQSK